MSIVKSLLEAMPSVSESCGRCGATDCKSFIERILAHNMSLRDCPRLIRSKNRKNFHHAIRILKPIFDLEKTATKVMEEQCNGCGNCIAVCPANSDPHTRYFTFAIINGKAKIESMDSCHRFDPEIGRCQACVDACPTSAIIFK